MMMPLLPSTVSDLETRMMDRDHLLHNTEVEGSSSTKIMDSKEAETIPRIFIVTCLFSQTYRAPAELLDSSS